ncbi:MAG TPA: hypothetical protein VGF94_12035 [Kofleriaceae bacterium]
MRRIVAFACLVLVARVAYGDDDETDLQKRAEAQAVCDAHLATCDWLAAQSSLERASLARALAARHYVLVPSPWGKRIAKVRVYNEPVFAEANWLRFFNFIHYTTRERAIRDELTISAGDTWDDALVLESTRRLRDPLYSSVVVAVPVESAEPGKIDLLVVTRDIWSLRLNSQYTIQEASLTSLSLSISENNFLGNRDLLAVTLRMDEGSVAVGPSFLDKNLLGSHLYLSVSADARLTRQALGVFDPVVADPNQHTPTNDPRGIEDASVLHREGSDSSISLSYPLWALASQWGGGVSFGHSYGPSRRFLFTGLRGVHEMASTGQDVLLPWEYELKQWSANANVVRQWGTWLKQQLFVGVNLSSTRPSLLPNFPSDPGLAAEFERDVFPRSELIAAPYLEYSFFLPRYTTLRNISTYDLAEDARYGPNLDVSLSQGLHALGSDYHFTSPSLSLGWTFPWCTDGFVSLSAGGSLRIQDAVSHGTAVDTIDNSASATVRGATPTYRYFRVIAQASISTRWNDTQNAYLSLGSDSGLRGYAISEFIGQRAVIGQVEARSVPVPWWVLRLGGVVFYEVGGAANSLAQLPIYQDIGFGIRSLIPQTSRDLFRFDLAFPIVAAQGWPAWHPQFTAGFGSYF